MRTWIMLIALMLFVSVTSAWTTGYEPPTCKQVYSIENRNFTITSGSVLCPVSSQSFFNTNLQSVTRSNGISVTGNISSYDATHNILKMYLTGGACCGNYGYATANTTLPSNGSYNGACISGACTVGNTTTTIAFTGIYNITEKNSTHFNITASGGTMYLPKNSTMQINVETGSVGSGGGSATIPTFSYSSGYTATSGTTIGDNAGLPALFVSSYQYISTKGTLPTSEMLLSDIRNGGNHANTSGMCMATLVYGSSMIVTPMITVMNTTFGTTSEAYANLITGETAYLRNNTDAYVLGDNGLWFYVPTVTCASYSLAGSVAVLYKASSTGSYLYGNYLQNGVSISAYTSTRFCANATDSTKNITFYITGGSATSTYNVTIYYNNTSVLSSQTIGPGATLSVSITPPANATYVVIAPLNPSTTGTRFDISNWCNPTTAADKTNVAAFIILWLIIILTAAFFESVMGAGVEAFTVLTIMGAIVSVGFYLPGAIMALYYGLRQLKAVME